MQNEITKISIRTNVVSYNERHQRGYLCKKGTIIVELSDDTKYFLDREAETDMTKALKDYVKLFNIRRTKEKIIVQEE